MGFLPHLTPPSRYQAASSPLAICTGVGARRPLPTLPQNGWSPTRDRGCHIGGGRRSRSSKRPRVSTLIAADFHRGRIIPDVHGSGCPYFRSLAIQHGTGARDAAERRFGHQRVGERTTRFSCQRGATATRVPAGICDRRRAPAAAGIAIAATATRAAANRVDLFLSPSLVNRARPEGRGGPPSGTPFAAGPLEPVAGRLHRSREGAQCSRSGGCCRQELEAFIYTEEPTSVAMTRREMRRAFHRMRLAPSVSDDCFSVRCLQSCFA